MSKVVANTVQLGQSVTPANNFVLEVPSVPNGTITLKRGDGTSVLSIGTNGVVSITAQGGVLIAAAPNQSINNGLVIYEFSSWSVTETAFGSFNSANGRFTPSVPGLYMVTFSVSSASNGIANASNVAAILMKNGSSFFRGDTSAVSSATQYTGASNSILMRLNGTTDYISAACLHNSDTARNFSSTISVIRVAA